MLILSFILFLIKFHPICGIGILQLNLLSNFFTLPLIHFKPKRFPSSDLDAIICMPTQIPSIGVLSAITFESVSGIDEQNPNSTLRWDLDSISLWSNNPLSSLPSVDVQSLLNKTISSQDISFYTSFSGLQEGDPYKTLKFDVSDYINNTIDFQDISAGFDLQLEGTTQNNALNKIKI